MNRRRMLQLAGSASLAAAAQSRFRATAQQRKAPAFEAYGAGPALITASPRGFRPVGNGVFGSTDGSVSRHRDGLPSERGPGTGNGECVYKGLESRPEREAVSRIKVPRLTLPEVMM
jgi:hypothetical protein